MPTERKCPQCGASLTQDAPQGLCPECLMAAALEPLAAIRAKSAVPDEPLPPDEPSQRIGRYKVLQKLGEGGCGMVYMAEQTEPVRRRVALKVIKLGMDTRQVIARFEAERQALALMDHPNIAKVLDAGATEVGRPYFVMELVKGTRITDYCDQNHLSTHERLNLFTQVCQAIQHAHQKGVIHRDIKPSNILVTLHDGMPVPKVIDFGIAKATEQPLTEKTVFTAFGQFMGTPAYMSPEQAELSGLDLDTRSDIYALGVLLYELLTGRTPFDAKELLQAGLDEMRRRIRHEEPMRPSTRLSTMVDADLTQVAEQRQAEPAKLARFIQGDLDWIVMKCLEKDRNRRYETANGLATDIRRHLGNEPVTACPPTPLYRFGKLVRRNKLAVAAATVTTTALVIGFGLATWSFFKERLALRAAVAAEQQQARLRKAAEQSEAAAQAVLQFFQQNVLAAARPVGEPGGQGKDLTIRQALAAAEPSISEGFSGQPRMEAEVRGALGATYYFLGDYLEAARQNEKAAQLLTTTLGPNHHDTLSILNNLALAYEDGGEPVKALPIYERTAAGCEATLGSDNRDTLIAKHSLVTAYMNAGQYARALPICQKTLELRTQRFGPSDKDTLSSMDALGSLYRLLGRYDDSIALEEKCLQLTLATYGSNDVHVLPAMANLASSYQTAGRLADALPLRQAVWEARKAAYGPEAPQTLISMGNLASLYTELHRYSNAVPILEETLRLRTAKLAPGHTDIFYAMNNLATAYRLTGRLAEALDLYERGVGSFKGKVAPDHPAALSALGGLALTYSALARSSNAIPVAQQALELTRSKFGPDHPDTWRALHNLAAVYDAAGRYEDAAPLAKETPAKYLARFGGQSAEARSELRFAAEVLEHAGEKEESEKLRTELKRLEEQKK